MYDSTGSLYRKDRLGNWTKELYKTCAPVKVKLDVFPEARTVAVSRRCSVAWRSDKQDIFLSHSSIDASKY